MFTITTIYDNYGYKGNLKAAHGFSCFIEEENLLFDTGGDGEILLKNMENLGIDPKNIKRIVISHAHWDHIGGLFDLLDLNPDVDVYGMRVFPSNTLKEIKKRSNLILVDSFSLIVSDIYSTGPLGTFIKEQSLAIKTRKGFLIVSGCAHPHISTILESVSREGDVFGIMGGFHSVNKRDLDSLESLSFLAPSHCTDSMGEIISAYPETFQQNGVGRSFSFE